VVGVICLLVAGPPATNNFTSVFPPFFAPPEAGFMVSVTDLFPAGEINTHREFTATLPLFLFPT
jgi:hypothetical protein